MIKKGLLMKMCFAILLTLIFNSAFAVNITEKDIQFISNKLMPKTSTYEFFDYACQNFHLNENAPDRVFTFAEMHLEFKTNELEVQDIRGEEYYYAKAVVTIRCNDTVEWIFTHHCHYLKPVKGEWFVDSCDN
jgi:hypothetical protein